MKKAKRKIISGAVFLGCVLFAVGTIVKFNGKIKTTAVPVSVGSYETEKPIIVLDAGHGGCS